MKKKFVLCVGTAMLSVALFIGSPVSVFTETVYADNVSMDEFEIDENGMLIKYNGTASEVVVPGGVTGIGEGAFFNCESLISIKLPEGITSIGDNAFSYCKSLISIELPEGVTDIGNETFWECESLTGIKLPKGITNIGHGTFFYCKELTRIELPEGITDIEYYAFEHCDALIDITLPQGLVSIGDYAFFDCESLTNVELPETINSIGVCWITGGKLTEINVSPQNSKYASYDNCLYNKDLTELITYPSGKNRIELPESIKSIGENAFCHCNSLTNIELPEKINSIGNYAFSDCESLISIKLPEELTSIGNAVFYNCTSLISIELPKGLINIEDNAFGMDKHGDTSCIIYVIEDSYAHNYMIENNIPFKVIQNTEVSTESPSDNSNNTKPSITPPANIDINPQPTGEIYIVDIKSNATISASDFEAILQENKTKNVIFKTNNDITFTFAKETMQAVNGKDSYDFQVNLTADYNSIRLNGIPEDSFIEKIDFIYSGELPGKADIRIPVGELYAGRTVYYYLINDNHTYTLVQSVIVDKEGYITVEQNHCSSYLVTSEKLQTFVNEETDGEDVTNISKTDENKATVMSPSDTNKKEDNTITPPKTGEFEELCFFLGAALLAVYIIFKTKIYRKI